MELTGPKNVRISDLAEEACKDLVHEGYFETHIDAYRTAICLAIARNLEAETSVSLKHNKWDSSAVFRESSSHIEATIRFFYPDEENIVEFGSRLAEAGLRFLQESRLAQEDLWKYLAPQ